MEMAAAGSGQQEMMVAPAAAATSPDMDMSDEMQALDAIVLPSSTAVPAMDVKSFDPTRLVDLKSLVKPEKFSGMERDWKEWRYKFEAMMSLVGLQSGMMEAAVSTQPVMMMTMADAT